MHFLSNALSLPQVACRSLMSNERTTVAVVPHGNPAQEHRTARPSCCRIIGRRCPLRARPRATGTPGSTDGLGLRPLRSVARWPICYDLCEPAERTGVTRESLGNCCLLEARRTVLRGDG